MLFKNMIKTLRKMLEKSIRTMCHQPSESHVISHKDEVIMTTNTLLGNYTSTPSLDSMSTLTPPQSPPCSS